MRTAILGVSSTSSRSKTFPGAELGVQSYLVADQELGILPTFSGSNLNDDLVHNG
jgi:hypothetical protein